MESLANWMDGCGAIVLQACLVANGANTAHMDGTNPSKYLQILETNVTQLVKRLKLKRNRLN